MIWMDVHAHLNMLEDPPEVVMKRAAEVGVERFVTIGTCPDDHPTVLSIAEKWWPRVFCTLGVHPHDADDFDSEVEAYLRAKANQKEVVAIGEIGLDYYYKNSTIDEQQQAFRAQLKVAADLGLPVEIHTRDAEEDTIKILKEFDLPGRGLIHCFTGTQWLADEALALGFHISVSGVVTFKKADELRQTISSVPLDRIHIETDSPFLAPAPQRGKKNEPAFMVHTAAKVAELKGVSIEKLAQICAENQKNLFPKTITPSDVSLPAL